MNLFPKGKGTNQILKSQNALDRKVAENRAERPKSAKQPSKEEKQKAIQEQA